MTPEHKAALAHGRALGNAVRAYLDALERNRPRRGRKRTPDSVRKRLAAIEKELPESAGTRRLEMMQERRDLNNELAVMAVKTDMNAVEKGFVKAAKEYSESKGISYSTWREAGVPADVLRRAGITRGS
jgi:nicotinamide mononucleotide adenylyltransferase